MNDVEGIVPGDDEVPEADAAEQQQVVDLEDEIELDSAYLEADLADRDANDADLLDQAIIVPVVDDWDQAQ
ncbi:MAG: hypothetical protein PHQ28_17865 [Mycobacterium sp.]|nr:hypothetical protein [Mycobacterium sp.]